MRDERRDDRTCAADGSYLRRPLGDAPLTKALHVRVTLEEFASVSRRALARGLSVSDYMREKLCGA